MMSGGDEDAFAFTIEVKVALKDGCLETRICAVDEALPALMRRCPRWRGVYRWRT